MEITNDFTIDLPPQPAYELLVDLDRVAPCMPGAELGEALADGSRVVNVHVKLGPMKFLYGGTVRIAEQDPEARRAVLVGTAKETRGQGEAGATITMQVAGEESGSRVSTRAEVELTGRAAQMGHGVVQAVAKQLMGQMAATLEERFAGDAAPTEASSSGQAPESAAPARAAQVPPPLRGGALLRAMIAGWLRRVLRRPAAEDVAARR